ncbi:phosphatidylserine decarboxylase [bacterium]|nr:phosphatidylserine decarboxylase [bacterium]MBU1989658.1 phosphatidylserine decarboxylase [bacterium]
MRSNLFPIAKEGWNLIGFSFFAFIVFSIIDLDILQFLSLLAIVFLVFVYRNPERMVSIFEKNSVVSPVDGVVSSIEELENSKYAYRLVIDSSYLDVPVLRVPLTSSVKSVDKKHGTRLSAASALSNKLNENVELVFEDESSNKIKLVHMSKQSFDGISINAIQSQKFLQGNRYGVMINGMTYIYLPQNFRLNVNVGNEIIGSETLIGYFSK